MGEKELKRVEGNLWWDRCMGGEKVFEVLKGEKEEMGLWVLGMVMILKGMGKWDEVRWLLYDYFIKFDWYVILFVFFKI